MKHFAALLWMQDPEKSAAHRPAHLEYLDRMRKQGHILANGPFPDGAGGMVVYRAESYEQAEQFVQADPIVSTGARRYEIHEWNVVWGTEGT